MEERHKDAHWLTNALHPFHSKNPILALPYLGYAGRNRFFIKGRVLKNENLLYDQTTSRRAIINTVRRMESDEIAHAQVELTIEDKNYSIRADKEGYFVIEDNWDAPKIAQNERWIEGSAQVAQSVIDAQKTPYLPEPLSLLLPSSKAQFGVISDIDDTILLTYMSDRFKLRMLYHTFFKNSLERRPVEGMVDLIRALRKGKSGTSRNPLFYVSNSPWNLYDMIVYFLYEQGLPAGPVLLRDYGLPFGAQYRAFRQHKTNSIRRILKTYPDLPFVMLGDTASKDADYYLQLSDEFNQQVIAIFIRQTKITRNAKRVAKLIEQHTHAHAYVYSTTDEIIKTAFDIGLIK